MKKNNKKDKEKALSEMSRLASRFDIEYVVIEDELIEDYAEEMGIKLTEALRKQVRETAFELLKTSLETAVQDAFGDIEPAVDEGDSW